MTKNRDFINIKTIPLERLDETFKICFTYTIQPSLKINYKNNKGKDVKIFYRKAPWKAQKEILKKGIDNLKNRAYYFEQHNDGRYHMHAFCVDTLRNMLKYMTDRYTECKLDKKSDYQDFCLLTEIVSYPPSWVSYCLKNQEVKDIFSSDIEDYLSQKLDAGIVKIETNNTVNLHPDYKFGRAKNFLIEI